MKKEEKSNSIAAKVGAFGFFILIVLGLINIFNITWIPEDILITFFYFSVFLIVLSLCFVTPIIGLSAAFLIIIFLLNSKEEMDKYTERTKFETLYVFDELQKIPENYPDAKCSIYIKGAHFKNNNIPEGEKKYGTPIQGEKKYFITESCKDFIKKLATQQQELENEIRDKQAIRKP